MKYLLLMEEIWLITEPSGMYIYIYLFIYTNINLVNNRITYNYISTSYSSRISFINSMNMLEVLDVRCSLKNSVRLFMSQWQCCWVSFEPFDLGKAGCNMMGPHHLQLPIYKAI